MILAWSGKARELMKSEFYCKRPDLVKYRPDLVTYRYGSSARLFLDICLSDSAREMEGLRRQASPRRPLNCLNWIVVKKASEASPHLPMSHHRGAVPLVWSWLHSRSSRKEIKEAFHSIFLLSAVSAEPWFTSRGWPALFTLFEERTLPILFVLLVRSDAPRRSPCPWKFAWSPAPPIASISNRCAHRVRTPGPNCSDLMALMAADVLRDITQQPHLDHYLCFIRLSREHSVAAVQQSSFVEISLVENSFVAVVRIGGDEDPVRLLHRAVVAKRARAIFAAQACGMQEHVGCRGPWWGNFAVYFPQLSLDSRVQCPLPLLATIPISLRLSLLPALACPFEKESARLVLLDNRDPMFVTMQCESFLARILYYMATLLH